jgi:hypothetical protein
MSIDIIKQEFYAKYPAFKLHNMAIWQQENDYFAQAFDNMKEVLYGNKFKLNLNNMTFERV